MKTVYVTAALGGWPEDLMFLVQHRFGDVNGVPLTVLGHNDIRGLVNLMPHPTWVKAFLWDLLPPDTERIMWLDADMVAASPMGDLPTSDPWMACPDTDNTRNRISGVRALSGIGPMYFNAGFFVATRAARGVFNIAQTWMLNSNAAVPYMYLDQTPLNVLVTLVLGGYMALPKQWNWMIKGYGPPPPDVKFVHFAGYDGAERESLMRKYLEG